MKRPLAARALYVLSIFAVLLAPLRRRTSWRWYRRALGGRWSLSLAGRWQSVKACPSAFHTDILGGEPAPLGCCFETLDGAETECRCEVWP